VGWSIQEISWALTFFPLAYIQLGRIAEEQKDYVTARKYYDDIIKKNSFNYEARCHYGYLMVKTLHYGTARRTFEAINTETKDTNVYSLLMLAHQQLRTARDEMKRDPPAAREAMYKRALDLYDKVLKLDPKNIYAGNGIAVVLAETGRRKDALEMFKKVSLHGLFNLGWFHDSLSSSILSALQLRDGATRYSPEININIAHCLFDMQDYEKATILVSSSLIASAAYVLS
jgi:tetratricopeptide (TPR) repeat protein